MKHIIIGRGMQFLVGLLTYRVLTDALSPEEFGIYGVIITIAGFYSLIFINPIGIYINRKINEWNKQGVIKNYFHDYAKYILIIAFLTYPISVVVLLMLKIDNIFILSVILSIYLISNTFNQTVIPSLNLLGKDKYYAYCTMGTAIFALVNSIILIIIDKIAINWLVGIIVSQVIFGMIGYSYLVRGQIIKQIRVDYRYRLQVFKYAWPLLLTSLFIWIQLQGYKFIVVGYYGIKEFGLLIASYGVAAVLMAAGEQILQNIFQPKCYREISNKNCWSNYANSMIANIILYATLIFISIEIISQIFLSADYRNNLNIIRLAIICEALRVINGIFSYKDTLDHTTKNLIYPNLIAALIIIPLILILINFYSIEIILIPVILIIGQLITLYFLAIKNRSINFNNKIDRGKISKIIILSGFNILINQIININNHNEFLSFLINIISCTIVIYISFKTNIIKINDYIS